MVALVADLLNTGPPALPPLYYRDNFSRLCQTVQDQYGDLLSVEEQAFGRAYGSLSSAAQCLYVRLVSRVGPWFRRSRLNYPEIGELPKPLAELLQAGLLLEAAELDLYDVSRLYTVAELRALFPEQAQASAGQSKAALIEAIEQAAFTGDVLLQRLQHDGELIVTPGAADVVALLQLLFFGNRHQNLTDFVLSDLGVASYYPYPLDRCNRLFVSRDALDEYLACCSLSDSFYELLELGEAEPLVALAQHLNDLQMSFPSSHQRWFKLCNALARELERQQQWSLAYAIYSNSELHPARERRVRVLEAEQRYQEALAVCEEILAMPWCEGERDAVHRIAPRLERKLWGKSAKRRRDRFETDSISLPNSNLSVELAAARHLSGHWSEVHYVENALMNGLFGLAFWEQIFAAVPGAFLHPYQSGPADMGQADFRQRREAIISARFVELQHLELGPTLVEAWHRYYPYQNRWMNWRALDVAVVEHALAVIPREHLLAIWERLLFDPVENRSGFPDLIALGEKPGDYRMIEVKGPGDTLQESQKRWLRFFQAQEIPASVFMVSWHDG
jgi:VRR-NUC domain/FAN1, HTH domain